jgi:hypothetical protein
MLGRLLAPGAGSSVAVEICPNREDPAMKVSCQIAEINLDNSEGIDVPSVMAICSKCGHEIESFGIDEPSVRRCLVLMREECPRNENNYYIEHLVGNDSFRGVSPGTVLSDEQWARE